MPVEYESGVITSTFGIMVFLNTHTKRVSYPLLVSHSFCCKLLASCLVGKHSVTYLVSHLSSKYG